MHFDVLRGLSVLVSGMTAGLLLAAPAGPTPSPLPSPVSGIEVHPGIVAAEIAPYVHEERGEVRGLVAEVVRKAARHLGRSDQIEMLPWPRAQSLTREGTGAGARLIIPLTRTPERENLYKWISLILSDDAVMVTLKSRRLNIESDKDARSLVVGMLRGSPLEAELFARNYPRLDPGIDEALNARKLKTGRIDAWLVARMVAPFTWRSAGYDPADLAYGMKVRTNDLWLAGSRSISDAEVALWQNAIRAVTERETSKPAKIQRR